MVCALLLAFVLRHNCVEKQSFTLLTSVDEIVYTMPVHTCRLPTPIIEIGLLSNIQ